MFRIGTVTPVPAFAMLKERIPPFGMRVFAIVVFIASDLFTPAARLPVPPDAPVFVVADAAMTSAPPAPSPFTTLRVA